MFRCITAASIAGLALTLTTPADAKPVAGRAVPYTVEGAEYEGYYVSPSATAPLVLIVHDWDGLTDYEIKRAQLLAELGYAVFAVDIYGSGVRPTELSEKQRLTGSLYKDRAEMRKRLDGGLAAAKALGANVDRAVSVGYCFGGSAVLEWARSGVALKGHASFHGGLATPEGQDYSKTKSPVIVFHGTADRYITIDEFAGLAKELEAQGVPHEMITYSGAPHAFSVFGSDRYRAKADRASWARFTAFLTETLR